MGDREGPATEGGVALKVSIGRLWVGRDPVVGRGKMCKHSVLSGRANFKCPGLCKKPGVTLMQGTPHPSGKWTQMRGMVRTSLHPTGLPGCGQQLRFYFEYGWKEADINGLTLCMGSPAAVWGAGRGKGLSVGIGLGRAAAAPGQGTGYHVCWGRGSGQAVGVRSCGQEDSIVTPWILYILNGAFNTGKHLHDLKIPVLKVTVCNLLVKGSVGTAGVKVYPTPKK